MGLLDRIFYGVDLDEEQARQDQLDQMLGDLNRNRLETGVWTPEQYAEAEANRIGGQVLVWPQVNEAFREGVAEQTAAVQGAVSTGISKVAGALPWWLWLAIGLVGLLYLSPLFLRRR